MTVASSVVRGCGHLRVQSLATICFCLASEPAVDAKRRTPCGQCFASGKWTPFASTSKCNALFGTGRRSQNEGHPSVRVATPWHVAGGSHPPVRQSCPREVYLLATSVAASPTWAKTRNWGLRLPISGAGNRHGQAVDSVVARLCQAGKFDYDGAPAITVRAQTKTSAKDLHDFVSSAG